MKAIKIAALVLVVLTATGCGTNLKDSKHLNSYYSRESGTVFETFELGDDGLVCVRANRFFTSKLSCVKR